MFFTSMSCVSLKSTWLGRYKVIYKVMLGSVCSVQECPVTVGVHLAEPSFTTTSCCTFVPCISTFHLYLASCCVLVVQTLLLETFPQSVWIYKKTRCIRQDPPPHSLSSSTCHQRHWPRMSQCCIPPSGDRKWDKRVGRKTECNTYNKDRDLQTHQHSKHQLIKKYLINLIYL